MTNKANSSPKALNCRNRTVVNELHEHQLDDRHIDEKNAGVGAS